MRNRLISELKKHLLVFIIGFAYLLWVLATDIYLPCPFRLVTGLKCPGCGITHMIIALSRFDLKNAFFANPLIFTLLPIASVIYILNKMHYVRTGNKKEYSKNARIFEYILLSFIVLFWIFRNI